MRIHIRAFKSEVKVYFRLRCELIERSTLVQSQSYMGAAVLGRVDDDLGRTRITSTRSIGTRGPMQDARNVERRASPWGATNARKRLQLSG